MTYEINNEIAVKVLQLLYDSWFKDFYVGLSISDLVNTIRNEITNINENQVNQALGFLQNNGLIIENDPLRYIITAYGIGIYEQSLPLEVQAAKKYERTRILQVLAEIYQTDTSELVQSEILREKIQKILYICES